MRSGFAGYLRFCGVGAAILLAAVFVVAAPPQPAGVTPSNVVVAPGYTVTAVATGLNFPTAMTFFGDSIWVTEAGIGAGALPTVKEIDNKGNITTVLTSAMLPAGTLEAPLTGILFARGWFWLIHRQMNAAGVPVGAISRFQPQDPVGTFKTVLSGLPSFGDHPASQIVFGPDDRAYFNVAAPTNSSVVGPDNGWALSHPNLHDFPAVDVELSGIGYKTPVPFPPLDPSGTLITEPFMPFGGGTVPARTVVHAATPANPQDGIIAGSGSVYSFDPFAPDPASTVRLEGWGFRTPYGIGFDPFDPNLLFVSNNGADTRQRVINGQLTIDGSRPIDNDWDDMFVIRMGQGVQFFGWPDYFHDPVTRKPLPVTDSRFCPTGALECPQFAFSDDFHSKLTVQPAFAELEDHCSANMFDFSRTGAFGHKGDIFIAETGSIPPGTGAAALIGYKIARIDRKTGEVTDFIYHPTNTQAEIFAPDGFNKPIDVRFRGPRMYIVDFGVFPPAPITPNSGKIWVVTRQRPGVGNATAHPGQGR